MEGNYLLTISATNKLLLVFFGLVVVIGLICCFRAGVRLVRAENSPIEEKEKTRFRVTVIIFISILFVLAIAVLFTKGMSEGDRNKTEYVQGAVNLTRRKR